MKKYIAAWFAVVALTLGGCASLQTDFAKLQQIYSVATTATVPAPTAQIAISSFEVLEAAATQYFVYCKKSPAVAACAPGTVSNPGPLRLVIKADRQGRAARDQIKTAGKTGALISSTTYNLLVLAVSNLSASPAATFGAPK